MAVLEVLMKKFILTRSRLLTALLLGMGITHSLAEDIDLFTGVSPNLDPPTVLLVWHSTANSSAAISPDKPCVYNDPSDTKHPFHGKTPSLGNNTVGGMEQCAMVNTMLSLKKQAALLGNVKVGLMMFNETTFKNFDNGTADDPSTEQNEKIGNGNGNCGFLVSPPELMDVAGIDAFVDRLVKLTNNNLANQSRVGDTVAEAWSMLNGLSYSCSGQSYAALAEVATQCRNAVMVYIGNATKENSSVADGNTDVQALLTTELGRFGYTPSSDEYQYFSKPMAVTALNNSGSSNNKFWGDEWTQLMRHVNPDDRSEGQQSVRNISTYSIAVYDPALKAKLAGQINFFANMANKGGGKSFLVDSQNHASLQEVLLQVLNEVQAVNSVFASATLPVSANTQGTFLNQVYIAMFRPDGGAAPRWYGNVKQFQLGFDAGGNIVLTDSTFDPANETVESVTNPITGTVISNAESFWTTNKPSPAVTGWPEAGANGTPDGFWRNSPSGDGFGKDLPDGDLVEKGGAAQMLRVDNLAATYADAANNNGRRLYTCNDIGACTSDLAVFNTSNASLNTSRFGVSSASSLSGVRMESGRTLSGNITGCVGGNTKVCTVTHGGTVTVSPGDRIDGVTAGLNDGCSARAPCPVTQVVSATEFKYEYSGSQPGLVSGVTFQVGSSRIRATISGHGLVAGDTSVVSGCSNTADVDGSVFGADDTGGLPASGSREIRVDSADANGFTFTLNPSIYASSGRISCTITTGVNVATLIKWVRGENNAGNEVDAGPCDGTTCPTPITIRPSVHGDVLHSRPAVINYGDGVGAVVFYGANDGVFRAINGNQEASIGGVRPGGELWGFVAPEFFGKLKRQYQNTPLVDLANNDFPGATPRDYFFDGTTNILQDDRPGDKSSTAGKRVIFMSARRGGPLLYALDVTVPTDPPKFLWKKTGGPGGDIPELGQTWSQPRVALVKGYADEKGAKPVVILGAGYDPKDDQDPAPAAADFTQGRGVIVLDAMTGDVIWAAMANCGNITNCVSSTSTKDADGDQRLSHALTHPIAADVTLFDNDFDGLIDRIYAADTGGNIWRVDLQPGGNASPSNWTMTKFASIAGAGNDARKFLFPPDVVPTEKFDIVVGVTGDREKPLFDPAVDSNNDSGRAYHVNNRFYVFVDKNGGDSVPAGNAVITESNLVDHSNDVCLNGGKTVACSYDEATDSYKDDVTKEVVPLLSIAVLTNSTNRAGYYITLDGKNENDGGDSEGEKGINAPLVVAGKAFFGTNQPDTPDAGSCTANLGIARAYKVDLFSGRKTVNIFSGGGMPPSPIAGLVTIGDETVPFLIGGEGPSAFDPSTPEIDLSGGRKRSYWYYK